MPKEKCQIILLGKFDQINKNNFVCCFFRARIYECVFVCCLFCCVSDLVSFTDDLRKEVKQLDSEMQMMVYDNYSKFIDATDTIRQMKTDVEMMEGEMNNLNSKMNLIADKATSLEASFQPNRSEVEKLLHLSKLLKKLDFLFSLPVRLKQLIRLGNYDLAVKNFKVTFVLYLWYLVS